jgi:hypothetical protein
MSRPSSTSTHLQITPTVPPAIHALASPTPSLLDAQLPAYLLPGVLSLLRDSAAHVVRRKRFAEEQLRQEGLIPPVGKGKGRADDGSEESELVESEAMKRVERIGLMVGGYVAEKWVRNHRIETLDS